HVVLGSWHLQMVQGDPDIGAIAITRRTSMRPEPKTALIVGAGSGLSASLARLLAGKGLSVAVASRHPERLAGLSGETGAKAFACNAVEPGDVERLFAAV